MGLGHGLRLQQGILPLKTGLDHVSVSVDPFENIISSRSLLFCLGNSFRHRLADPDHFSMNTAMHFPA